MVDGLIPGKDLSSKIVISKSPFVHLCTKHVAIERLAKPVRNGDEKEDVVIEVTMRMVIEAVRSESETPCVSSRSLTKTIFCVFVAVSLRSYGRQGVAVALTFPFNHG